MNDDDVIAMARMLGALRVELGEVQRAVRMVGEAVTALADRIEKLEGGPEDGGEAWVH